MLTLRYRIYPKIDLTYKLRNFKAKTHVLRTTNGSIGAWYDLTDRIPDALLTAVIDFVEIECAAMNWSDDKDYEKIRRKLIKTDKQLAIINGLAWIKFQKDNSLDNRKHEQDDLIEIYEFAKTGKASYLNKIEDLYRQVDDSPFLTSGAFVVSAHNKAIYAKVGEVEKEMQDIETELLCKLIKIRHILWT